MRWTYKGTPRSKVAALSSQLGISHTTAALIARLGLDDAQEAASFLKPRLQGLQDPFLLKNLDAAVGRLRKAMRRAESIVVFGDYDVDGITSTVFLLSVLNTFGVYPRYIVPRRLEEGYGLSKAALSRLLEQGAPDLLIAVDCGTNSVEEVALLRAQGIDVIIIDHHQSKEGLPEGAILVNPHVNDGSDKPWSHLCTVGLIFKFIHGLLKQLRNEGDEHANQVDLKDYLDLVALGTVADLVPLVGENRILAKRGLELLCHTRRVGLGALFEVSGLTLGSTISPFDVAFRLSPRINASGRLGDACEPIEMLLADDLQQARQTARLLDEFNRERQDIEREIARQAEEMVEAAYTDDPGIVLFHPDWHAGVVGIVASRITAKYHRPTIVLGAEGEQAKGSGRSIPGLSLVDVLTPCAHLLGSWGGHPMAVGVSLSPDHLETFRKMFCASILEHAAGSLPERELEIACWLEQHELSEALLHEINLLEPFGQGNPEPVFGIRNLTLENRPVLFGKGHYRFLVPTMPGKRIQGVAWRQADRMMPTGRPLDIAVRLTWNVWNDQRLPQLQLEDWRFAHATAPSAHV